MDRYWGDLHLILPMAGTDLGFTKSLEPRERGQTALTHTANKYGLLFPLSTELSKSKELGFQRSF